MIKCPFCGSNRLQTTSGKTGNPFDRRPEKTVCLECGRTFGRETDLLDLITSIVCLEITVKAAGIVRTEKAEFPYEDGTYDLSEYSYPICKFHQLKISGNTADFDGGIVISMTDVPYTAIKHYTAYAPDKHPEQETIEIKIYTDIK